MADDMNRIVYEQQQFFDEAAKNVEEADYNVASGTQEVALVRSWAQDVPLSLKNCLFFAY